MDYIFINTDFYLETDIDYASLNLTSSKIVVPRMVVDELKKTKTDKSKKILETFEEYKKLKYFIFDNETNPQNVDILDFVFEFHCDKKFFASFSMDLLSKNTFDLFFECKEFAQKEVISDSVAKKFVPIIEKSAEEDSDVAKNILALCYSCGYGLEQNTEQAIEWFKKARKANIDIGIKELYLKRLQEEYDKLKKRRKNILKASSISFILGVIGMIVCIILEKVFQLDSRPISVVFVFLFAVGSLCIVFYDSDLAYLLGLDYRKKISILKKEIANFKSVEKYRRAAAEGDRKAQERLKAMEKKKSIDDIVQELNADKITEEHTRAKRWYWLCVVLFVGLIFGLGLYMRWNLKTMRPDLFADDEVKVQKTDSIKNSREERLLTDTTLNEQNNVDSLALTPTNNNIDSPSKTQHINSEVTISELLIRILISMSILSMIFIFMNQAARSRKNMVLLSKEIQEYKYIGALLKGKVDMSTDGEETNKEINQALNQMIQLHLDIQKQRLEKEDHSEVKDITPDVLNFFKDNTSTMMGNFNEMQKNILDLHKTIVQTLKDKGDGK